MNQSVWRMAQMTIMPCRLAVMLSRRRLGLFHHLSCLLLPMLLFHQLSSLLLPMLQEWQQTFKIFYKRNMIQETLLEFITIF